MQSEPSSRKALTKTLPEAPTTYTGTVRRETDLGAGDADCAFPQKPLETDVSGNEEVEEESRADLPSLQSEDRDGVT